jgi:hypothetical protein
VSFITNGTSYVKDVPFVVKEELCLYLSFRR